MSTKDLPITNTESLHNCFSFFQTQFRVCVNRSHKDWCILIIFWLFGCQTVCVNINITCNCDILSIISSKKPLKKNYALFVKIVALKCLYWKLLIHVWNIILFKKYIKILLPKMATKNGQQKAVQITLNGFLGAGGVTWTRDLSITNRMHYQLCYTSIYGGFATPNIKM